MNITKLFLSRESLITPKFQGVLAITLDLDHLLKREFLLPVVWRRFGVPDRWPGFPFLFVFRCVTFKKALNVRVHLEAEEFQQLLTLRGRFFGNILITCYPEKKVEGESVFVTLESSLSMLGTWIWKENPSAWLLLHCSHPRDLDTAPLDRHSLDASDTILCAFATGLCRVDPGLAATPGHLNWILFMLWSLFLLSNFVFLDTTCHLLVTPWKGWPSNGQSSWIETETWSRTDSEILTCNSRCFCRLRNISTASCCEQMNQYFSWHSVCNHLWK